MPRKAGGGRFLVVTGIEELDGRLKALAPAVQKKHVRKAMRVGLKILQKSAKAHAPVKTGALRKSIVVRATKKRKRGVIGIEVRTGAGFFKGKTFYAAFLEFGTRRTPARPFMAPAFAETGAHAKAATLAALRDGVEAEVRALGRT